MAIVFLFIVIYILGEIFFPPLAFLAGLGFMIYSFTAPCFVEWWMKFLLICIGLFMVARGISLFLLGDNN